MQEIQKSMSAMGFHRNKILNIAARLDTVGIVWLCKNYLHQAKKIESCVHPIKLKLIAGHHTTEATHVEPYLSCIMQDGGLPTIILPYCIWKWADVGVCTCTL